jgi:hypothetical protein
MDVLLGRIILTQRIKKKMVDMQFFFVKLMMIQYGVEILGGIKD